MEAPTNKSAPRSYFNEWKAKFIAGLQEKCLPVLTDESMLKEVIMRQITDDEEKRIINMEGIHFNEVIQLSIENKDIAVITHMWDFSSLEKLYLAHNLIRQIEGLHHLFNLRCLNLSFNHIEKIEGLESLRKLEVLELSNNRISVIENMDTLEKLTEVCIRNNVIGQMQNVLYLRKFKNLETLELSGNPVSDEEQYKSLIEANFPNLMYLDNILLDKETKASSKCQTVHKEMRSEADHKNDFEQFLNGCCPSGSMFKDDPEAGRLHRVPDIAEVMEKFEIQIQELFKKVISVSVAEHNQREAEMNSFTSVHTAAMKDHQKKTSEIIQQNLQKMMEPFQESDSDPKKNITQSCNSLTEKETYVSQTEIIAELQQISDPDLQMEQISHCNNGSSEFSHSLTEMELLYFGQIEDTVKLLDRNLTDMICNFSETAKGIFSQCRDVEDEYYNTVCKVAVATLEKVAKEELGMDIPADVIMLFTDRDAVMDALDTSHANHLRKINDMETQLLTHVDAWKAELIKGIQDKELLWNRTRRADCHSYMVHLREEVENTSVKYFSSDLE